MNCVICYDVDCQLINLLLKQSIQNVLEVGSTVALE